MPRLTVFTPVWNRVKTLPRLWHSLLAQTEQDFEWIVSDDASTDGTAELLEKWQGESPFDVRIVSYPRRTGKPRHDNDIARLARSPYLLMVGSDDQCLPNAVDLFATAWESIPEDDRDRFCIINAQTVHPDGRPLGATFASSPVDTTPFDLCYVHRMHYDSWHCYRTDLLRENPYPEVDFIVPESVVWAHGNVRHMQMRCFTDVVGIIHRDAQNKTSLTQRIRYGRGYAHGFAAKLNNPDLRPYVSRRERAKDLVNLGRLGIHGGMGLGQSSRLLEKRSMRLAMGAFYPLSIAVAFLDRRRGIVEHTEFEPWQGSPRISEPTDAVRRRGSTPIHPTSVAPGAATGGGNIRHGDGAK